MFISCVRSLEADLLLFPVIINMPGYLIIIFVGFLICSLWPTFPVSWKSYQVSQQRFSILTFCEQYIYYEVPVYGILYSKTFYERSGTFFEAKKAIVAHIPRFHVNCRHCGFHPSSSLGCHIGIIEVTLEADNTYGVSSGGMTVDTNLCKNKILLSFSHVFTYIYRAIHSKVLKFKIIFSQLSNLSGCMSLFVIFHTLWFCLFCHHQVL
jgi:hypothetical protein